MCVWAGAQGVDGGWMPLPTRPQRYCDPASLAIRLMDGPTEGPMVEPVVGPTDGRTKSQK